jgi:hypothetical protein
MFQRSPPSPIRENPCPSVAKNPWYFDDATRVQRLRNECESWRGTPFHFGSSAKGGGAYCVGFCKSVFVAVGVVKEFNITPGPEDMSLHVHNDKILNFLRGAADDPQSKILSSVFAELTLPAQRSDGLPANPTGCNRGEIKLVEQTSIGGAQAPPISFLPGDLVLLRTGKGLWHMLVMLSPTAFMQCACPDGVTEGDITAPNYREHLVAAFRARKLATD